MCVCLCVFEREAVCERGNDYSSKFNVYTDNVLVRWKPHKCSFAVFPVETLIGRLHSSTEADKGVSHLVLKIKSKPMG